MKKSKRNVLQPVLYDRLRIKLEQERYDLQHRIDRIERQLLDVDGAKTEPLEAAGSDQEALLERSSHCRHRLKLVIQGLQRIRQGTFGLCQLCEEPIGQKRLEALPTAQHCIKCQEELERSERDHRLGEFLSNGQHLSAF